MSIRPERRCYSPRRICVNWPSKLSDNITVFDNSPIRGVEYGIDEHCCRTQRGAIVAGQLLLATNAFLPQLR